MSDANKIIILMRIKLKLGRLDNLLFKFHSVHTLNCSLFDNMLHAFQVMEESAEKIVNDLEKLCIEYKEDV